MIEVRKSDEGRGLFTKSDIRKGQLIAKMKGRFLEYATKHTLQIDEEHHLEGDITDFMNHSCDPNTYIDFDELAVRAAREIKEGEELTFNYLTSEWDMKDKFKCSCGSKKCYGEINGFKHLTDEQKNELGQFLSPFLRKKMKR